MTHSGFRVALPRSRAQDERPVEAAKELGSGRASVYRALEAAKASP